MRPHNEIVFESDIVRYLTTSSETLFSKPYLEGEPDLYNAELGLYQEDLVTYMRSTQTEEYDKLVKKHGSEADKTLAREVARYLDATGSIRSFRRGIEFVGSKFRIAHFKPDNLSNVKAKEQYDANILRVVRQIRYSPFHQEMLDRTGHGSGIIDLVIFLNGIPIITVELKTDFTQSVHHAMKQYKKDRSPINSVTKKPEPILAFNKRTLVHFAVSNEEVYMTTKLEGEKTKFLPFNKGNGEASGNPPNPNGHATAYLWEQVLEKETLLKIIGRFIHLQEKDKEGKKLKPDDYFMVFPRYHQLDCVTKLIDTAYKEGAGHHYLIQHSAGSGKSNSIAWLSHQLASLTIQGGASQGKSLFRNVIVVTDRNVLDSQLQDTIYQFDHQAGVVKRISREEGSGSKSQKLAEALLGNSPIIIVTIQTFPFILEAIQQETSLKDFTFAVIADEAHSSQTGKTASKLKEILQTEFDEEEEVTAEDMFRISIESKKASKNISYFAFTATPKPKTLEIFGRLRFPDQPKSKENTPIPFHTYTMQQAIEEGFILDVLKNYITYDVAYRIANQSQDKEVDTSKAKTKISKWVRLHPHNISQKIAIIIEHYRTHVRHMLNGNAKAMVVTGSRKEAVRYKLELDKYIRDNKYTDIHALVAFSGEIIDKEYGVEPFTEKNINPSLDGKELREAFDGSDFQIMLVANKFLTGFDQPKLCAMYIDKKFSGVDCVQALSRMNRIYPNKDQTFILDFVNKTEEIIEAFSPFYKVTNLSDNSDPNDIFPIKNKLVDAQIFTTSQVEDFANEYYQQLANIKNKKQAKLSQERLSSIMSFPGNEFKQRYKKAVDIIRQALEIHSQAKQSKNDQNIKESEKELHSAKEVKATLDQFKAGVNKFLDFYEFMSNIVDYDNEELEKLYLFLKHLKELLKVDDPDNELMLSLSLSHYKIHNKKVHNPTPRDANLDPEKPVIGSSAIEKKKELLSEIIDSINDLFEGQFSDNDALDRVYNFGMSLEPEVMKNPEVLNQMKAGNSKDQIMLGDYPKALSEAIMNTINTNKDISAKLLNDEAIYDKFARAMLNVFMQNLNKGMA
ncbi:type I restriction endonuclease subunit R [Leptospira ilyithenensis]|uniref:Type I restriction endonuclease subunit R n=2 Tax=Leptospira ilyithenensis TaxID=2484901 RepID=A0A4R9LUA1_9LEPT|nr:type I restriction endonuclease subunit R [Leptospira ilyithenensis]